MSASEIRHDDRGHDNMNQPKYKRILLKLSGEALAEGADGILNFSIIEKIADVIKDCTAAGVQVAVLVGAGNIWRGRQGGGMDRVRADHMGMLATTINSLALADTFEQKGISTCVLTAVEMQTFADTYSARRARAELEAGKVVVLGCGSGLPFFSTDTAAVLRAAEIGADMILMAKNIDGVYNADPRIDPTATRYDEITYGEILEQKLRALDMSATLMCMENDLRCYAFALQDPQNIYRVVMGERVGTEMHN